MSIHLLPSNFESFFWQILSLRSWEIFNKSGHYSLSQIRVSESYGLKFPREFALLMKQLLYFDRYTRLLAPDMNMLQDERVNITSERMPRTIEGF